MVDRDQDPPLYSDSQVKKGRTKENAFAKIDSGLNIGSSPRHGQMLFLDGLFREVDPRQRRALTVF